MGVDVCYGPEAVSLDGLGDYLAARLPAVRAMAQGPTATGAHLLVAVVGTQDGIAGGSWLFVEGDGGAARAIRDGWEDGPYGPRAVRVVIGRMTRGDLDGLREWDGP